MKLRVLFLALASLAGAECARADEVAGSAVFEGQRLSLTHGLAWWDARSREVKIALFDFPPGPGILADLRKGVWDTDKGPKMSVHLRFQKGAPPERASLYFCYLSASFDPGGPMGTNTNPEGCGLSNFSGVIKPGGDVAASLQGRAEVLEKRPFAWDLRFSLPIAK